MKPILTVSDFLEYQCKKHPQKACVGKVEKGQISSLNFKQYREKIYQLATVLHSKGLKKGDKLVLISETSLDWHLIDMACLVSGVIIVPIYPNTSLDQMIFILEQTKPQCLVIDQFKTIELLTPFLKNSDLSLIVTLKEFSTAEKSHLKLLNKETVNYADAFEVKSLLSFEVGPHDIATITYTSGTTGVPKGAVHKQEAIVTQLKNLHQLFGSAVTKEDRSLCFLPLSHVLGRIDSLLHLAFAHEVYFSGHMTAIVKNLELLKPTIMIGVPRIFEKIYQICLDYIEQTSTIEKSLFKWAQDISEEYFEKIDQDLAPSTKVLMARKMAHHLVYSRIHKIFGGNIRFFVCGGAPLAPHIITFLRNANMTLLEGYGLTETFGPCSVTPVRKQIPGMVGTPFGDIKLKLADDGEILVSSKILFTQYLDAPEETKSAFREEWYATGDIGEFSADGFLKITDRKKDIIITSTGKNVAPQRIEGIFMSQNYISSCLVIGNNRKFLSAVIGVEKKDFRPFFDEWEISSTITHEEFTKHPKLIDFIKEIVDRVNQGLSDHEMIKKFLISPIPLGLESGHLTPGLKLKRNAVEEDLRNEIDTMYKS